MTDLRIAPAADADAGELLTVQYAAYLAEAQFYGEPRLPPLCETLAEVRADVAAPDVHVLTARLGHRLAGSVRLRCPAGDPPGGGRVKVVRLAVAPDLQRRGIARALLAAAEAAAPAWAATVWLDTGARSAGSQRLYTGAGYRITGTAVDAAGVPLVVLEKSLRPRPGEPRPDGPARHL
jgi:ribosomal protein S18 acetylase RimI-like enzyme